LDDSTAEPKKTGGEKHKKPKPEKTLKKRRLTKRNGTRPARPRKHGDLWGPAVEGAAREGAVPGKPKVKGTRKLAEVTPKRPANSGGGGLVKPAELLKKSGEGRFRRFGPWAQWKVEKGGKGPRKVKTSKAFKIDPEGQTVGLNLAAQGSSQSVKALKSSTSGIRRQTDREEGKGSTERN